MLRTLQQGVCPLGQFDAVDAISTTTKGGEVLGFTYLNITSADQHAADINDGYFGTTTKKRPALTTNLVSGMRPLMLCDDGSGGGGVAGVGYGTLFGSIVGSVAGQQIVGVALGPHTARGSGKLTAWDKPGLYQVSLDACDATATTGLQPTNSTLAGNDALYATSAGLLTPNVSAAFESVVVGRFMEFVTSGSYVTTPANLVSLAAAVNLPAGNVGSTVAVSPFVFATFHFHVGE